MPRVSVVIPTYNCAEYLPTAIESVLSQSHQDLELIIVDDGSTDGTADLVAGYQGKVRYIRTDNMGVAAARNRGLNEAGGEVIGFLDADDWWVPWKLTAQLAALEAYPQSGLLFSDFFVSDVAGNQLRDGGLRWKYGVVSDARATPWTDVFGESRRISWSTAQGERQGADAYHGALFGWLFRGNMINTSSVLLRRTVVENVGFFDSSLTTEEDYDYWLRVARGWPMTLVDLPLLHFRRRPGQLTEADQIERILLNVETVLNRASRQLDGELDAAEVNRRIGRIHRELSIIKLRQGNHPEARLRIRHSLQCDPGSVQAKILLLLAYMPPGLLPGIEKLRRKVRPRASGRA